MSEVAAQRVVFDVLLIKSYLVAAAGERAKQSAIRRGMPVAPGRGDGQPEEGDFQGKYRQPESVMRAGFAALPRINPAGTWTFAGLTAPGTQPILESHLGIPQPGPKGAVFARQTCAADSGRFADLPIALAQLRAAAHPAGYRS